MDNTNLIMRAKIGVHNQGKISLEIQDYDSKTVENTVEELKGDGYKVTLGELEGSPVMIVERFHE